MKGTEKQIKYAQDIKSNILDTCDANIARFRDTIPQDAAIFSAIREKCAFVLAMLEKAPGADDAKFWIDNKDRLPNPLRIFNDISMMMANGRSLDDAIKSVFGF